MKKNKETVIVHLYELRDPRIQDPNSLKSVKYVGMTIENLKDRLYNHLSDSKRRKIKPTYCQNWIKGLLKENLKPTIHLIKDVIGWKNGSFEEINLIKQYKELGCRLTNLSEGGEGITGSYSSIISKRQSKKRNHKRLDSRQVIQYDLTGTKIAEYDSFKLASLATNINRECIRLAAEGLSLHAGGFLWSFKDCKITIPTKMNNPFGVDQFNLDGTFIKHWKTAAEAGRMLGHSPHNINACAKGFKGFNTAYGFLWKYSKITNNN